MTTNGYDLAHPADLDAETSYTFTCGKIDAGIAVLIGSHAHLIEFPSLLLPPGCEPGSIVSITCSRNLNAEESQAKAFWELQSQIFNRFGSRTPQPPNLRLRSVTQTSVALEWNKLELAQCKLLSLSIWKNGQRLGPIPNPLNNFSTKLSGLDLDTEYTFNLVMKTTGGTYHSRPIKLRTHSLNDTSGINVCFGVVVPEELLEESKAAIEDLGGQWTDKIQIDTTHFVCTMPVHQQQNARSQASSFPSLEYQRALQLSIPIVQPTWLLACLAERKMVPISAHYLGATPTMSYTASTSSLARSRTESKAGLSAADSPMPGSVTESKVKDPAVPSDSPALGNSDERPTRSDADPAESTTPRLSSYQMGSSHSVTSPKHTQAISTGTESVSNPEANPFDSVSPKTIKPDPQQLESEPRTPPKLEHKSTTSNSDSTIVVDPTSSDPASTDSRPTSYGIPVKKLHDDPFSSHSPSVYDPSPVRPLTDFGNVLPSVLTPVSDQDSDRRPATTTTPQFLTPNPEIEEEVRLPESDFTDLTLLDSKPSPNRWEPDQTEAKSGGGEIADVWMGSMSPITSETNDNGGQTQPVIPSMNSVLEESDLGDRSGSLERVRESVEDESNDSEKNDDDPVSDDVESIVERDLDVEEVEMNPSSSPHA